MGILKPDSIAKLERGMAENKRDFDHEWHPEEFAEPDANSGKNQGEGFTRRFIINTTVAAVTAVVLLGIKRGCGEIFDSLPVNETSPVVKSGTAGETEEEKSLLEKNEKRLFSALEKMQNATPEAQNLFKFLEQKGFFTTNSPNGNPILINDPSRITVIFDSLPAGAETLPDPIALVYENNTIRVRMDDITSDEWLAVFIYHRLHLLRSRMEFNASPPVDRQEKLDALKRMEKEADAFTGWMLEAWNPAGYKALRDLVKKDHGDMSFEELRLQFREIAAQHFPSAGTNPRLWNEIENAILRG